MHEEVLKNAVLETLVERRIIEEKVFDALSPLSLSKFIDDAEVQSIIFTAEKNAWSQDRLDFERET